MERGFAWKTIRVAFLTSLCFLPTGCYSGDEEVILPTNCCTTEYLTISITDFIGGTDITECGEVTSVDLFLFRSDNTYYDHVWVPGSTISHRIPVSIKGTGTAGGLQIVAWGNLNEHEVVAGLTPGCKPDTPFIRFKTDTEGWCIAPDNLFLGYSPAASSPNRDTVATREIVLIRKNARMTITVRGLPLGSDASDYYFIISGMRSGYSLRGSILNTVVNMKQTGVFSSIGQYLVTGTPFALAGTAPGEGLTVSLYRYGTDGSGTLVASVKQDSSGQLIAPSAGQTANVLIDLSPDSSSPSVSIVVTPWNEVYQWVIW